MSSGPAIELLRGFARAEARPQERNAAPGRQVTQEFASLLEGSRARRAREPERRPPAAETDGPAEKRRAQSERRRDDVTKSDDAALMEPPSEDAAPRASEDVPAGAAGAPVAGEETPAAAPVTAETNAAAAAQTDAAETARPAVPSTEVLRAEGLQRLAQIGRAAAESLRTAPVFRAAPAEGAAPSAAAPTVVSNVPAGTAAEPTRVPERAVVEAVPTQVPVARPVAVRTTSEIAANSEASAERPAAPDRPVETAPRAAEPVRPVAPIEQVATDTPVTNVKAPAAESSAAVTAAAPVETRREVVQRRGEAARIEARIISERRAASDGAAQSPASQVARALIGRVEGGGAGLALQELRRERIGSAQGFGEALTSQSDGGLSLRAAPGGGGEAGGVKAAAAPLDLRAELAAEERTAAVEQIVEAARAQVGSRRSQVTLQLEPPELGRLRIDVQVRDSAIGIQVRAETQMAHELLQSRMGELRRALESHGMTLDRAQVELRSPEQTSSGQTHERGLEQQTAFEHDGRSGWGGEHGRAEERGDGQPDARTPMEMAEALRGTSVAGEIAVSESTGINLLV